MRFDDGLNELAAQLEESTAKLRAILSSKVSAHRSSAMLGINAQEVLVRAFYELVKRPVRARLLPHTADPGVTAEIKAASGTLAKVAAAMKEKLRTKEWDDGRLLDAQIITEELAEFLSGLASGDEAEALDGLADLDYVVHGRAMRLDLPLAEAFIAVHDSNMTKEGDTRSPGGSKGKSYVPPNLRHIVAEYRTSQLQPHILQGNECKHCGKSLNEMFQQFDKYGRCKCLGTKL